MDITRRKLVATIMSAEITAWGAQPGSLAPLFVSGAIEELWDFVDRPRVGE
jgi:hypothetical protein